MGAMATSRMWKRREEVCAMQVSEIEIVIVVDYPLLYQGHPGRSSLRCLRMYPMLHATDDRSSNQVVATER